MYPLSQAANPPANDFADAKDLVFDSTIRYDAGFFDSLHRVVQSEPWLERDRLMIGYLRSLVIEKGKPSSPDAKTKELLTGAAREAQVLLEQIYDAGFPPFWEGSHWTMPANWVPTDPKRGFEAMFRLYAPTKPLFEKTWRLPDIVKMA